MKNTLRYGNAQASGAFAIIALTVIKVAEARARHPRLAISIGLIAVAMLTASTNALH